MPSKRQPSKQRRAAQNRAQREALAARREHASRAAGTAARSGSSGSSGSTGGSGSSGAAGSSGRGRSSFLSGLTGTGGARNQARPVRPLGGIGGRIMGDTAGEPGARGVLLGVPLALAAAVWLLGFARLDVDDRGELLPISGRNGFRGLYLATREALTGNEVMAQKELGVSAVGAFWLMMILVPLLVVLGVFFLFRFRRSSSMYWTVTIGMLLIAATVLLLGRVEFVGAMAALTWASFQIRRSELPAKMAEREAVRAARAEAAAAEAAEDDGETYDDEAYEEEAYEDEAYAEDDDAGDDDTEYEDDEDAYEDDEDAYDEDDTEYEDDDAEDDDAEDDDAEDDAEPKDGGSGGAAGYDEDILKELEAELDEGGTDEADGDGEGEGRRGGTGPGRR